jgi:hypothetical protein
VSDSTRMTDLLNRVRARAAQLGAVTATPQTESSDDAEVQYSPNTLSAEECHKRVMEDPDAWSGHRRL